MSAIMLDEMQAGIASNANSDSESVTDLILECESSNTTSLVYYQLLCEFRCFVVYGLPFDWQDVVMLGFDL